MKNALLALALALVPSLAFAAPPASSPPPKPPHAVQLTDDEIAVIQWYVITYGGEHCGPQAQQLIYCQGAIGGNALLNDLEEQLKTVPPPPKPVPAK